MLLNRPRILANNPECYTVEYGVGYVPTEIATEEERKAIEEYNRISKEAEARMAVEIIDEREKKLLIKQAKERGIPDEEINSWFK